MKQMTDNCQQLINEYIIPLEEYQSIHCYKSWEQNPTNNKTNANKLWE
jgi:hypothetical protein